MPAYIKRDDHDTAQVFGPAQKLEQDIQQYSMPAVGRRKMTVGNDEFTRVTRPHRRPASSVKSFYS